MSYALQSGIHVSIDGTTWYKLTDHNRQEIDVTPFLIEKEARMANGTLRKFVVAKKDIISVSWDFLPSKPASTGNATNDAKFDIVDGNYSGAWIESFYNANAGIPIYVKIVSSKYTDPQIGQVPSANTYVSASTGERTYQVFMTGFSKTIRKRNPVTDFLDITLEFTEI
jgi:hypothetical protein